MALIARNLDTGTVVADNVAVARHARDPRRRAAESRAASNPARRCGSCRAAGVHTWGMRFAIDVVALDDRGVVIDQVSALKPWRIRLPRAAPPACSSCRPARSTRTGTEVGHRIELAAGRNAK